MRQLVMLSLPFHSLSRRCIWIFVGLAGSGCLAFNQQNFRLEGKILDKNSGLPLAGAHIELKKISEKGIAFLAVSGEDGFFELREVAGGYYKFRVSFLGFKSYKKDSLFITKDERLPDIFLKRDSSHLKPITIEDKAPDILLEADRKVYKTEAFLNAAGGSALDILRTLPGIQVEPNGRVSLRGSRGVLIYVDGRQSSLSGSGRRALLQSLPADQIEQIEVITQPGASFDAEGVSGIINIVLKKSAERGFTAGGNVMAGSHNKYNAGAFVFYSSPRWNISAHYNFRYTALWARGTLERTFQPGDSLRQHQNRHGLENGAQHNGRFSMRYQVAKPFSVFLEGSFRAAHKVESRYFLQQFQFSTGSQFSDRLNSEAQNDRNAEVTAGFQFKSQDKKHEFKGEASYSDKFSKEFDRFITQQLDDQLVVVSPYPELRKQLLLEGWRIQQARLDYEWKFRKNLAFETGLKSTWRHLDSDFSVEDLNYDSSRWQVNPALTNHFVYSEWVPAGYVSARWRLERWSFKAGLRAEWTSIRVTELTQNLSASNRYLRWFPSASIAYKAGEKMSIRLSYARRINRPSPGWLNPFPDISDPLLVRFGNPYLNPEISETGELSLEYKTARCTFTPALYGRWIRNVMGRFLAPGNDGTAIQTYRNLSQAWSAGTEWVARYQPSAWFQVLGNVNLFYYAVSGENLQSDLNNSAVGGLIKLVPEWRWRFFTFFLSGQYILPQATVQNRYRARYFLDAALRADLWQKKLSLTLSLSDVFNSYYNYYTTRNAGFVQNVMRKNETRIVQLHVAFRLNKRKPEESDGDLRQEWENGYND